jgi:hypothetical protein
MSVSLDLHWFSNTSNVCLLFLVTGRNSAAYASTVSWKVRHYHIDRRVPLRSDVRIFSISASRNRMTKHWFRSISNFLFFPLRTFERNFCFASSFPTQSCNGGECLRYSTSGQVTKLCRVRCYVIMTSLKWNQQDALLFSLLKIKSLYMFSSINCSSSGGALLTALGILHACYVSWLQQGWSGSTVWHLPVLLSCHHHQHRHDGDTVALWNVGWFKQPDAADSLGTFHCIVCSDVWRYALGPIHTYHAFPLPCHEYAVLKATFQGHGRVAAGERHGMRELASAVQSRHVGNLPAFGFFRLPRGVPGSFFLSEAYQPHI